MLYAIVATDVSDSGPLRAVSRDAHIARLTELAALGRLVLAGPFPAIDSPDPGAAGCTGSLIVAEFESVEQASGWADGDPYVAAGVYAEVVVRPFRRVLP